MFAAQRDLDFVQGSLTNCSGASHCSARCLMITSASGRCGAEITGVRGLMIPAFSPAILVDGMAQPFLVVEIDRRDDADRRLHGVRGIESSAHAGLEHDKFAARCLKMFQRESCRDFKKCRVRIPTANSSRISVSPLATSSSEIISPFTRIRSRKVTR